MAPQHHHDHTYTYRAVGGPLNLFIRKIETTSAEDHTPVLPETPTSLHSPKNKGKAESPTAKLLIGGISSWVFELCIGHTVDFIKISKQVNPIPYPQIVSQITKHRGMIGLLDGFFPWGSIQSLTKGAVFGWAQAISKRFYTGVLPPGVADVASGGTGGLVQGMVMSPILLLKTRVMTMPGFRQDLSFGQSVANSFKVGKTVIQQEGVRGLTKGSLVFSTKRMLDWSSRYFFVVLVENQIKGDNPNQELSLIQRSAASLAGGSISTVATIPIDVLVAQFQQASKAGSNVSVLDIFREHMKKGGVLGLVKFSTRGLMARIAHVSLTTLLMKTVTSSIYESYLDMANK